MADKKVINQSEEKPVFSSKASEFEDRKKGTSWFIIISVVALVLIVIFIITKNWTAVGVVVACAFALISFSTTSPRKIKCSLYHTGIVIQNKTYRFTDLKSFWMIFGDHPRARFSQVGRMSTHINMPIAEEDPEQIRLFLLKYLPEQEDQGEDLSDTLSRWIKF